MAKGKYHEWLEPDGLTRLEGFARSGLTDLQIAAKMGISAATLYQWQIDHPDISEAIKRGKKPVDDEVENTLLKSALGYEYEEIITEIIESPDGQQRKQVKKIKHYAQPNTTAQIFWLKNRRPDKWRDRQELAGSMNLTATNIVEQVESLVEEAGRDQLSKGAEA